MFDIFVALLLAVVVLETAALAVRALHWAERRLMGQRLIAIARGREREKASRPQATPMQSGKTLDVAETTAES